jgi:hypothetical protein
VKSAVADAAINLAEPQWSPAKDARRHDASLPALRFFSLGFHRFSAFRIDPELRIHVPMMSVTAFKKTCVFAHQESDAVAVTSPKHRDGGNA